LKKITDVVASYHHFATTTYRYFGVSDSHRKNSQELFGQHSLIVTAAPTSNFALILDYLFTVSKQH